MKKLKHDIKTAYQNFSTKQQKQLSKFSPEGICFYNSRECTGNKMNKMHVLLLTLLIEFSKSKLVRLVDLGFINFENVWSSC